MTIYQSDPDQAPDSEYEPGEYHHLVPGNAGRMMDSRRTPVSVVSVHRDTGFFVLRIEDFEDKGALWEVPFEKVSAYCQFALNSRRADAKAVRRMEEAARRFDQPLEILRDESRERETRSRIASAREAADRWLAEESAFFSARAELPDPGTREGHPSLYEDLQGYMTERSLWTMEESFARQFVSNPDSGEMIKGHRIVFAEMGLVSFSGKVLRDATTFEGEWSKTRREDHILARMGFVQAFLSRAGLDKVTLYRGFSTEDAFAPPRNHTFVSTSFSEEVARSHYDAYGPGANRVLWCQAVPIERVFMTYLETEHMNRQFREAEAVLLFQEDNPAF